MKLKSLIDYKVYMRGNEVKQICETLMERLVKFGLETNYRYDNF